MTVLFDELFHGLNILDLYNKECPISKNEGCNPAHIFDDFSGCEDEIICVVTLFGGMWSYLRVLPFQYF